jgi:hypothetical protein
VVSDVLQASGAIDARRLGQVEHADSLRARNARIPIGSPVVVKVRRSDNGRL